MNKWGRISTSDIQRFRKIINWLKKIMTEIRKQYFSEMKFKGEMSNVETRPLIPLSFGRI